MDREKRVYLFLKGKKIPNVNNDDDERKEIRWSLFVNIMVKVILEIIIGIWCKIHFELYPKVNFDLEFFFSVHRSS